MKLLRLLLFLFLLALPVIAQQPAAKSATDTADVAKPHLLTDAERKEMLPIWGPLNTENQELVALWDEIRLRGPENDATKAQQLILQVRLHQLKLDALGEKADAWLMRKCKEVFPSQPDAQCSLLLANPNDPNAIAIVLKQPKH